MTPENPPLATSIERVARAMIEEEKRQTGCLDAAGDWEMWEYLARAAIAALSTPQPAAASAWMPIETAPGGKLIDVWMKCQMDPDFRRDLKLDSEYRVPDVTLTEDGRWIAPDGDRLLDEAIVAWRHRPAPPAALPEGEGSQPTPQREGEP